ncbi:serine protease inhibitor Kazal-type 1-like isoform X3 [Gambusia affinis]|uniref:serine protease inhibitor Kazal-type 1-like isoform X3 n=1 Tax=Gambusia affinis TaxID=33528 RepID=UPI001CDCBB30|nr:serine protease inhibitor Kazal-type 1-like isoform X3 [Gambusia affinis]
MTARPAVLGLLIICVAAGKAGSRKAECFDDKIWDCTSNVNPVCGNNGVTYANECFLCNEIRKTKKHLSVINQGTC